MDIDEFERLQNEALKFIPAEFQKPIKKIAWDIGHAYGYNEVLIHIRDIADAFEMPIRAYHFRISGEDRIV